MKEIKIQARYLKKGDHIQNRGIIQDDPIIQDNEFQHVNVLIVDQGAGITYLPDQLVIVVNPVTYGSDYGWDIQELIQKMQSLDSGIKIYQISIDKTGDLLLDAKPSDSKYTERMVIKKNSSYEKKIDPDRFDDLVKAWHTNRDGARSYQRIGQYICNQEKITDPEVFYATDHHYATNLVQQRYVKDGK